MRRAAWRRTSCGEEGRGGKTQRGRAGVVCDGGGRLLETVSETCSWREEERRRGERKEGGEASSRG